MRNNNYHIDSHSGFDHQYISQFRFLLYRIWIVHVSLLCFPLEEMKKWIGAIWIERMQRLKCTLSTLPSHLYHFYSRWFIVASCFFFLFRPSQICVGKWTGTTGFHSNSGLLAWAHCSWSLFSWASIISKQLSGQTVPSPNHSRPITGQLRVWI